MAVRGRRTWLRRIVRLIVASFAALIVLVVVALLAVRTDWGRDQVRERVEAELDRRIRGSVNVGHLHVDDLLDRVVLHDITVKDARGIVVVTVEGSSSRTGCYPFFIAIFMATRCSYPGCA